MSESGCGFSGLHQTKNQARLRVKLKNNWGHALAL
jgi:hypothetical protein